jgi:hypothetical protein
MNTTGVTIRIASATVPIMDNAESCLSFSGFVGQLGQRGGGVMKEACPWSAFPDADRLAEPTEALLELLCPD